MSNRTIVRYCQSKMKLLETNPLAELLSSRVKAELFRLLFGMSEKPLHLRELERQSGLAVGTVRQELKKLTGLGLVKVEPDGNRTQYQADRNHPLFPEIHGLVLKTVGLTGVLRPVLEGSEIELAFIFGSVAAGSAGAESDIDLLVVGGLGLRQLVGRLGGLSSVLGREINPHIFTADEFTARRRSGDHFLSTVLAGPVMFVKGDSRELAAMV